MANTLYEVAAYAYSGSGSLVNYQQTTPLTGSRQTQTGSPVLTTPTSTAIDTTLATMGATVTSNGGIVLTERGTLWNTSAAPTTANNKLAEGGTTTGAFSHSRAGLPVATRIYFRGYAINANGTGYSPDGTLLATPLGSARCTIIWDMPAGTRVGAQVDRVAYGLGMDDRIGAFVCIWAAVLIFIASAISL